MEKLTAEKSREQFEEWYWNEFGQFEDGGWLECFAVEEDEYYRLGSRMSWAAWKASRQAIEIALPVLEQQEQGEHSWLHWNGEMALPPVDSDVRVEIKRRNGEVTERQAKWFVWLNSPVKSESDIIAYRVIENDGREE